MEIRSFFKQGKKGSPKSSRAWSSKQFSDMNSGKVCKIGSRHFPELPFKHEEHSKWLSGSDVFTTAGTCPEQSGRSWHLSRGCRRQDIPLHWLPVSLRVDIEIVLLVFKSLSGTAPSYISDCLSEYVPNRSLRSSTVGLLNIPKYKL